MKQVEKNLSNLFPWRGFFFFLWDQVKVSSSIFCKSFNFTEVPTWYQTRLCSIGHSVPAFVSDMIVNKARHHLKGGQVKPRFTSTLPHSAFGENAPEKQMPLNFCCWASGRRNGMQEAVLSPPWLLINEVSTLPFTSSQCHVNIKTQIMN